ncbi:TM1266 family iron-only hydrogenase system putative regulator [Ruminococcus sp. Marseille-P6503]|uniref:TM1266 family iron-only hydrogenase system putative regulator n=1 Tax=Ruminococcus sp. Marseille-P6503 TaxID=2364796 RepID=UPI000F54809B|nr:TM1266 family iron-only hydrogenase system putative regulator [Ruminococcus sp. Marseille-P6503]
MNRIALIGIMVEDQSAAGRINEVLHQYGKYIIGRMGIPHAKENLSVISVVLDAPEDIISAVSGKLGMIRGVSTKTIYSRAGEIRGNSYQ